ncbi:PLP-dependent aminotransferase family protein [Pseudomonas abieticivorans]|uniref:aminotransferase-like domain-containing protein n=1 Tax=Pseudomonas abieticivorans TaxID=2931382 RepID=UPI0020C07319|nr:PLP-dependent aminotransferase family protein [Pseudomonas sp. PIA16]
MPIVPLVFVPGTPKVQQIVDALQRAIEQGALPIGSKLPAVRELTEQWGVSKFTVIEALDRLRGRGLITSSQGRGHFVAATGVQKNTVGQWVDLLPQDLINVLRRSLITDNGALRAGSGHMPEAWLDSPAIRQALRSAVRAPALRVAGYGTPGGYLPLRQALQQKLHGQGMSVQVEQIVTAPNTLQAIDMLMRLLVRPGDTVLLDAPCYFNFHANLALHGVNIVSIARGPEGHDLVELTRTLASRRPRVYLTTGILHNPTGHAFTPSQAFQLLHVMREYGCHVIEDDLYADLHPSPPPRLAALAGLEQVTYLSGFSKTLSANMRVSYIAAAPQLAANLMHLKLMSGGIASELFEQVLCRLLVDGGYAKHRKRVTQQLQEAAGRVCEWLRQAGCELPYGYQGGLFVWAKLPMGADAEVIARSALEQGLVLAPGALFGSAEGCQRYLRFNVAYSDDARVRDGVQKLLPGS